MTFKIETTMILAFYCFLSYFEKVKANYCFTVWHCFPLTYSAHTMGKNQLIKIKNGWLMAFLSISVFNHFSLFKYQWSHAVVEIVGCGTKFISNFSRLFDGGYHHLSDTLVDCVLIYFCYCLLVLLRVHLSQGHLYSTGQLKQCRSTPFIAVQ